MGEQRSVRGRMFIGPLNCRLMTGDGTEAGQTEDAFIEGAGEGRS